LDLNLVLEPILTTATEGMGRTLI